MNSYYNQNYTKEEIHNVLRIIKKCIIDNNYTIAMNENRQENIKFISEYNICNDKQKYILLQLEIDDFCYSLQNTKPGYEYEVLYVFVPQVNLFHFEGTEETVDIYIKINIIDTLDGNRVAVISFHKRNKPISYLFK